MHVIAHQAERLFGRVIQASERQYEIRGPHDMEVH